MNKKIKINVRRKKHIKPKVRLLYMSHCVLVLQNEKQEIPWCLVRLYPQLFVRGLMSYLCYLCLFAYSGVQCILCCFFVIFLCLLYPMDCPIFIAPSYSLIYVYYTPIPPEGGYTVLPLSVLPFYELKSIKLPITPQYRHNSEKLAALNYIILYHTKTTFDTERDFPSCK